MITTNGSTPHILLKSNDEGRQVIYLAGPMGGHPGFNYDAFREWATMLRNEGIAVMGPHETLGGDTDMPRDWYMRHDIMTILLSVDLVALLPGWRDSGGATLEARVATACGIPIGELYRINDSFEVAVLHDYARKQLLKPLGGQE